ncbi:9772_t:CDS:2 [Ambispora gerdemannii]|uniref:9772_t:CDS:1 n=1 Tax=Ambispora gerdemannii TaxID=144530 RepID=A0A9N9C0M5_9GLOM|nr:9772_t:CDS:2 [Ambispora gerdemannii]
MTYITDVIMPLLRASLSDLPNEYICLSTAERQSLASKARRNGGTVEELEQKNIKLETRLAILEQGKEEKSISTEDVSHSPAVLQNKNAPTSDVFNNVSNSDKYQSQVSDSSLTIPPICSNEASASQAQNSYSDSSPKSHDELHVKQISELQSIPNTFNLPEEFSEQNTDLQKTKIPEIDIQPLIEELRIEPLAEDTVKVVNVNKNSTDRLSLAIELVHLFEKISLAENNTKRAKMEEITSWYQYRKHFKKRLDDILSENQKNDKRAYDLASEQVYDKMLQYLSAQLKKIKLSELKLIVQINSRS